MADNVVSNAGSGGPTWATDEIGSVHYPRMKIVHGADGSATDTSTAAPLPVVVPGSVAVTGTFWQATQPVSFTWAGLTDAQLRATAVAVSVASLPLPTGAATDAGLVAIAGHVDGLEAATGAQADAAAAADGTGDYSIIAGIKRALLNWASLLGRVPAALVGGRFSVASSVPHMSTGVIMSAQTAATGTNWVAFASQACVALDIVNNTGTTIEYRRGAAGTAMQIPAGAARMVIGITNANQIDIRRTDTSNTQVTAQAEAFQH